ncbi:MAG: coniferyl-alcohol dehydrogenase [Gammaproteobacteria bacterium]|nr:coniferyl-alcohol dehydrogenase [Gammaproteobacteria bacterium]
MSSEQIWTRTPLLQDKTIVVTGCASGIGLETSRLIKELGGDVIGVDRTKTEEYIDELYVADMSDPQMLKALVRALPDQIDGIANIAGLPPTAPAEMVLKVNFLGLRYFTENMIAKLNDGASIVNLASLAGLDWSEAIGSINEFLKIEFDGLQRFMQEHRIDNEGGRSYFFSKEALIVWTMQNRWTWRERGIRMNAISPGPVDTPILKDFIETLGERAEEDMRVMDRPGTAQDIAPVVAFVLSDMTSWLRGSNIPLDGGMSSHIFSQKHGF